MSTTRPQHARVANPDASSVNDSTSTPTRRRHSPIRQTASDTKDRSQGHDSTQRGDIDATGFAIFVAWVLLIIFLYEFGFWGLLSVVLPGFFRLLWVALLYFWRLLWFALGVLILIVCVKSACDTLAARPSMSNGRGGKGGNGSGILTEKSAKRGRPRQFSYEELKKATDSFASDQKLGRGGSGTVYKGHIGDDRKLVAVKKITSGAQQATSEFIAEVTTMIQLSHRNLVKLKGYGHKLHEFALVYEFIGGGTLYYHLFECNSLLTWERRYKIALGLASAVCYLHERRPQCVLHRDIKSRNIMLDKAFVAKLGDFGLAKFVDHNRELNTTRAVGTPGYWDPEYYLTWKASKKSDIYSFGVVLLEIVSGRKAVDLERDPQNLVLWVWKKYGPSKLLDAVDTRLGGNFHKEQAKALMIVGLWCVHPSARCRPSIEKAMTYLNLTAEPRELPSKMPAYFH